MFKEKEQTMEELYHMSQSGEQLIYMEFNPDLILLVKPDTWFTDENDYEDDDPRYEEWECGVFKIVSVLKDGNATHKVGELIEVTYRTFPTKIIYNYSNK